MKAIRKHLLSAIKLLLIPLGIPLMSEAKVVLPQFFSDNMVLQQKENVPLWGTARPGSQVRVSTSWNKKEYTVVAGQTGEWRVKVLTPSYGGPWSISFNDGETTTLSNVMIGEVWICSGQSNMEMPLEGWGKIKNYKEEIAAANYPNIRLLQVQKNTSITPLSSVKADGGGWQVCTPGTISNFSAVAYFFGRNIYEKKHIPIGLIHTSWGGTIAEAWTSGTSLKKMEEFAPSVEAMEKLKDNYAAEQKQKYDQEMTVWNQLVAAKDPGFRGESPLWAQSSFDDSKWQSMTIPTLWESAGLKDFDGAVWFRKRVIIPESWAGKDLTISLGPIDDMDQSYFNGIPIGNTDGYDKPRTYTIKGDLVKPGVNTLTVRVFDGSGGGGIYGSEDQLFIAAATGEKLPLNGAWSYKATLRTGDVPPIPVAAFAGPNRPTVLYNAMIHPLIPYAFRGVIWYQGESNAGRAWQYRQLFPLMITDWRTQWGRGNFPFYFVQLANYMQKNSEPVESEWAELREAQKMALPLPNTGMAVTIDIGEENDIHPKNKQEVGRRLSLIALANIYNEKVSWSGPLYKSFITEGNKIRIAFAHTDRGLLARGNNELKGFAIAGADHKFHWAKAVIEGNAVLVSSSQVDHPIAVRYNWSNNPDGNLYNGAGLPASPFRTDDFQAITFGKK